MKYLYTLILLLSGALPGRAQEAGPAVSLAPNSVSDHPSDSTGSRTAPVAGASGIRQFPPVPAESRLRTDEPEKLQPWYQRPPDIALLGGAWLPVGRLSALGAHPCLGLAVGSLGRRWEFGASAMISFLPSAAPRLVRSYDSLFNTRHFFGVIVTLDAAYALVATDRYRFELLGGLGFMGIDVLDQRKRPGYEKNYGRSLFSPDLNAGAGYRFRLSEACYLGLQAKYYVLAFRNTGGTDLAGHAITVGTVFGFNGSF